MANVEITLKTIDDTKSGFNSAAQGVDKYTKQVEDSLVPGLERARLRTTDFLSANAALIGVVIGVGLALKGVYDETIKYADQVRQLSQVSGASTEETSRFIQVLDDYKISAEDALAATKALTNNGYAPSIETLAKLSDQYLSLNSIEEQNAFVLKNLGRNGLQWVEILNKGSDAILAQGDAVNQSLILSQKQVDAARKNELAIDELNDSWMALKVSIGNEVIPVMNTLIESHLTWSDAVERAREELGTMNPQLVNQYAAMLLQQDAANSAAVGTIHYSEAAREATGSTKSLSEAAALTAAEIDNMTKANNSQLSLIKRLQVDSDSYNKELEEMKSLYGANSEQVKKLEADHKAAMASIAYDLYVAKLQAGGFTDAEFEMALAAGVAAGVIDQATANMAMGLDNAARAAFEAGTDLYRAADAAELLAGDYYVNIITTYTTGGGTGGGGAGAGGGTGPGGGGTSNLPTFGESGSTGPYAKTPTSVLTQVDADMIGESVARHIVPLLR